MILINKIRFFLRNPSPFKREETVMCIGVPGQIVQIKDADNLLAIVSVGGLKREVNIACLVGAHQSPQRYVGDWVLVHVGFAMARIDEQEAAEMLIALSELDEMD